MAAGRPGHIEASLERPCMKHIEKEKETAAYAVFQAHRLSVLSVSLPPQCGTRAQSFGDQEATEAAFPQPRIM